MGKADLMRAGTTLVRVLPDSLSRGVALAAADACWLLLPRRRRALAANLRRLVPRATRAQRRRLVRSTFRKLALCSLDLLRVPVTANDHLIDMIEVQGLEHLDAALAQGRGAILVTGHVGNWDLAGVCLAARGYAAHAVVEDLEPDVSAAYRRYRGGTGLGILPIGASALPAFRVLQRKELLILLGDRALGGRSSIVDFAGGRRELARGPAELACRSGAPVLIAYLVLHPDANGHRYLATIEPPLHTGSAPLDAAPGDVERLTHRIGQALARVASRFPDQWFVFQPGWQ